VHADHPTGAFSFGGAGPLNTYSASTLQRGGLAASFRLEYLNFDRFSDAELPRFGQRGIETDSLDYSLNTLMNVGYGVTDEFTFSFLLPHRYQDDIREPEDLGGGVFEVANEGDTSGLGDLQLLGTFKLFDWQCGDDSLMVSAILGVELPSGRHRDRTREGEIFELEHQPGSQSWDPIMGLAISRSCERWSWHLSSTYTIITEGTQDTELGDIASFNAAVVYRLLGYEPKHDHGDDHHSGNHSHDRAPAGDSHDHAKHDSVPTSNASHDHGSAEHCHRPALDIMLELNGFWQEKHRIGDEFDDNSGGTTIFLSPGIRRTMNENWSIFFSAGFPVVQEVNGHNHEADYRLMLGTSVSY
jgi:hypothetical protein